jgi:hypothetical protein
MGGTQSPQFMSVDINNNYDNNNNSSNSMAPQVSNCTTSNVRQQVNSMLSSFTGPSGLGANPQQLQGNNNNMDFVNNVEQNFLQQVLGNSNGFEPGMVGESRGPSSSGRPQTVEQLLAIMNNSNNSMNQLQRYHRSASLPGMMPSTTEFTYPPPPEEDVQQAMPQRRRMPANQRRATSGISSSAQAAELQRQLFRQQRRASSVTFGSAMAAQQQVALQMQQQRTAKELDIGDEEIMGMFMRAP